MANFCGECGAGLADGAKYCGECGRAASVLSAAPSAAAVLGRYGSYQEVPWYRRSGSVSAMLGIGFLLIAPLLWAACIIALTGDVYYSKLNEEGQLATWSAGNKVAAVVILVISTVGWIYILSLYGRG